MRKQLFIVFALLIAANPSFAYKVTTFQPLAPAYQNLANAQGAYENYPKIAQVEAILFNRSYDGQNIYNRLSRIEQRLFKRQFKNMPLASRVDNILANVDEGQMYGISTRDLAKLESRIFGRTFPTDDSDTRITRLEKEMLGAMQQGNLRQRYAVVKNAAKHYNAFPQQTARNSAFTPNNYYNQAPKQSILTRILDNVVGGFGLGSMAGGSMTGYTPPLYDPYSQYNQSIPGAGAGMQDYFMGNNGGYYNNRNIGSGAGIRILN